MNIFTFFGFVLQLKFCVHSAPLQARTTGTASAGSAGARTQLYNSTIASHNLSPNSLHTSFERSHVSLQIIADLPDILAVCKPGSMPVHPAGRCVYECAEHHLARVCNPLHTQADLDLPFSSPLFPRNSRVIIDLRYRRNSLVAVLAKEHALADLYVTHRLDRLTSGVVIFAKNKSKADDIRRAIE